MAKCYLREGNDTIFDVVGYPSIASASRAFQRHAEDLDRFGQALDATIHIAKDRDELVEDADYYLSLGPRGGLRRERC